MQKTAHCLLILFALCFSQSYSQPQPTKLYWFIPDGLRAEPDLFKLFEWAQEGYLPHIKYMMDHGAHGYSKPVFPTHTPVNFAALLSGCTPKGMVWLTGRCIPKVFRWRRFPLEVFAPAPGECLLYGQSWRR